MSPIDKNEIHKLIDMCEDEAVLYEIKERLSHSEEDWWDELSKEEQDEIIESDKQVQLGNYHTIEEVHKMMEQWKEK